MAPRTRRPLEDLLRVETVSVIRRQLANGALTTTQATNAIDDLLNLPITVYPSAALLRRAWELRDNATASGDHLARHSQKLTGDLPRRHTGG